ncbi:MAG: DUF1684 domain-containing protein [Haliscomenobacter sp.]
MTRIYLFIPVFLLLLSACQTSQPIDPAYLQELSDWRAERMAELKAPDGWLALAGLYWLEKGENTFGSGPENKIQFPVVAPAKIGTLTLEGDSVRMTILPGTSVREKGQTEVLERAVLKLLPDTPPTMYTWGSLQWVLIERGGKYGIRLWDTNSVRIHSLDSIPQFPVNPRWRVEATLRPADANRSVTMQNVLGMTITQASAGTLAFTWEGKEYQLEALQDPEGYFLIFSDDTSGKETYGGGRYLYAPTADANGKTIIDFNKAYNPPCAFTKFATCLLPPAENSLPFAIRAGELSYGDHD